ncbi:MAG: riboflavin synthase [Pseudomonadota bacterium]|nr:MAG: riboflavin synthase [Pseudomonadota bacterium]
MFTGIIQAIGTVAAIEPRGEDVRLRLETGKLDLDDVRLGDSIAVDGVCLTAVQLPGDGFWADVSGETLACTTLEALGSGARVNLEKALTPTTRMGGHLVSGHVDGVGEVVQRKTDGRSERFNIKAPDTLARYIAAKGSICVNGISLTVNAVHGAVMELNIVPHTLQETTMDQLQPGTRVNLEVDIIARYLERLLLGEKAAQSDAGITRQLLADYGFVRE